jgi:hypothetical protein
MDYFKKCKKTFLVTSERGLSTVSVLGYFIDPTAKTAPPLEVS